MEKRETERILKTIEYYYSDGEEHKRCPVCGIDPVKLEQELDKVREELFTEREIELIEDLLVFERYHQSETEGIKSDRKIKESIGNKLSKLLKQ